MRGWGAAPHHLPDRSAASAFGQGAASTPARPRPGADPARRCAARSLACPAPRGAAPAAPRAQVFARPAPDRARADLETLDLVGPQGRCAGESRVAGGGRAPRGGRGRLAPPVDDPERQLAVGGHVLAVDVELRAPAPRHERDVDPDRRAGRRRGGTTCVVGSAGGAVSCGPSHTPPPKSTAAAAAARPRATGAGGGAGWATRSSRPVDVLVAAPGGPGAAIAPAQVRAAGGPARSSRRGRPRPGRARPGTPSTCAGAR